MKATLSGLLCLSALAWPLAARAQPPAAPDQPAPQPQQPPDYPAPPPGYPQPPPPPGYPQPPPPPGYPPAPPPGYPPPPPAYPPQYPQGYPPPGYPPQAYYQQVPPDPGRHKHDGFFLRFLAGAGYTSVRADLGPNDGKISGGGGAFAFALGGALTENLVLYGEIIGTSSTEPEVEDSFGTGTANDVSAGLFGMGAGLAFYFPNNLYLSGTLAITQFTISDEDGDALAETDIGPGLSLTFGKEWWVSDNWGLGAAVNLFGARMKDKEPAVTGFDKPLWKALSLNLMFTASFN